MDPSFLLAFPLLLALSTPCNACVCKLLHPQSIYCLTDVVIIVDILGPGQISGTRRTFQVNVTKVLKAPKGTREIHYIYTPRRVEKCGYTVVNSHQSELLIAGLPVPCPLTVLDGIAQYPDTCWSCLSRMGHVNRRWEGNANKGILSPLRL
ncbi:hypothetical protein P7K49_036778 [Saguinus oedipus]|uniref:NTR domain-containing protein n=1 Tax=Saguinus oedipus TaxID=9490 RepID=A0ABQ9TM28_SAGOE|nr:hypothetical protein P7K49_036778 [Saguinus oedipus]